MYELQTFNIYPDAIEKACSDVDYAIEIFGLGDYVWDYIIDDYENGGYVDLSDLTNSIISICYSNLQSALEDDGVDCDYYVNGYDSHFYVNGEKIQDLDKESAQKILNGEDLDDEEDY